MAERRTPVVCVVDDDESLRRSVRNLLSSVGFRVETFASAEAFLQSAHRSNTGCVVLDLRMPGMSGLDLLMHLGATGTRIPVVILTAHGDDDPRRRTLPLRPPLSAHPGGAPSPIRGARAAGAGHHVAGHSGAVHRPDRPGGGLPLPEPFLHGIPPHHGRHAARVSRGLSTRGPATWRGRLRWDGMTTSWSDRVGREP